MLLNTPRCPEKVISSPSGPCTMLTPGVSVRRSSNLRPRIGVDSIVVSSSVLADAVRVVSTAGDTVVTGTDRAAGVEDDGVDDSGRDLRLGRQARGRCEQDDHHGEGVQRPHVLILLGTKEWSRESVKRSTDNSQRSTLKAET